MSSSLSLAIDLGTGSAKVGIFNDDGELLWVETKTYEPHYFLDRAEIDPNYWWLACETLIRSAPRSLRSGVGAIGFSGQMHGLVLVDSNGAVRRNAILWPDRRAVGHTGSFVDLATKAPGLFANPIVAGMPGPILSWLVESEPELWDEATRCLAPKDWLRSQLTGEAIPVSDHSDASASLIYDAETNGWSDAVVSMLGLPTGVLPPLRSSDSVAGSLRSTVAQSLGLTEGIPVVVGAGDAAAALWGSGIDSPGSALMNVGTGAQTMVVVERPLIDLVPRGIHNFRTASAAQSWYSMAATLNGGLVLGWARQIVSMDWPEFFSHAQSALEHSPTDPRFEPFLVGERDPQVGSDPSCRWTELRADHDRAALARSALLGVATYLAHRTRLLLEATDTKRIVASGGSIRNHGWTQLLADLVDHPIEVSALSHASLRGAARLAASAQSLTFAPVASSELFQPRSESRDLAEVSQRQLAQSLASRSRTWLA